ncbi:MAG: hypothetical protein V1866_06005 [archaeon]
MINNDEDLGPEEKIRNILEAEKNKLKEIEEKKSELDKKKKEIEVLEQQRKVEIASGRKRIEAQIEEISLKQKRNFEVLEEIHRKREQDAKGLEEQLEGERPRGSEKNAPLPKGYGDAVNEIIRGKPGFYDITNYNVMNRLEQMASEVSTRSLSKTEKEFIEVVQYHAEKMNRNDFYRDKDESNYLSRELAKIDFINKMTKKVDADNKFDYRGF